MVEQETIRLTLACGQDAEGMIKNLVRRFETDNLGVIIKLGATVHRMVIDARVAGWDIGFEHPDDHTSLEMLDLNKLVVEIVSDFSRPPNPHVRSIGMNRAALVVLESLSRMYGFNDPASAIWLFLNLLETFAEYTDDGFRPIKCNAEGDVHYHEELQELIRPRHTFIPSGTRSPRRMGAN